MPVGVSGPGASSLRGKPFWYRDVRSRLTTVLVHAYSTTPREDQSRESPRGYARARAYSCESMGQQWRGTRRKSSLDAKATVGRAYALSALQSTLLFSTLLWVLRNQLLCCCGGSKQAAARHKGIIATWGRCKWSDNIIGVGSACNATLWPASGARLGHTRRQRLGIFLGAIGRSRWKG